MAVGHLLIRLILDLLTTEQHTLRHTQRDGASVITAALMQIDAVKHITTVTAICEVRSCQICLPQLLTGTHELSVIIQHTSAHAFTH